MNPEPESSESERSGYCFSSRSGRLFVPVFKC